MIEILNIYKQAVKNVPILRYSWILIATICILALTAFFKLNNSDVFIYAIWLIFISFLGFIFSYLLKTNDGFIKFLLRFLITCIVITISVIVLGFGTFIIWKEPDFYSIWLPSKVDKVIIPNETNKIEIEPTTPQFDSSLLNNDSTKTSIIPEKNNKIKIGQDAKTVKNPSQQNIEIVHTRKDVIDGLPCKYFTILNSSGHSVIINKCAINILEYKPYTSIPETQVIKPLVIWDIILPYRKGNFEYIPTNTVLIANEEAGNVGIRFSCLYGDEKINPNTTALYRYTVTFITSKEIKIVSQEFLGF